MSNHLAIAAVTAALEALLSDPVDAAVTGAKVLHDRPDRADPITPNVNVYLFDVVRHAALAGDDLPTRRADGSPLQRAMLPLTLHYLVTFYGKDDRFEPQRLMGAVMTTLHEQPVLTRGLITSALDAALAGDPEHPLATSDLADQTELVRMTLQPLDLEAKSKLWSVFFQTPYSLSVAYEASLVLLDGEIAARPSLPVREPRVYAVPTAGARIDRIEAEDGPFAPITAASTLRVIGERLASDEVRIRVMGEDVVPDGVSPGELRLVLAAAGLPLRAGIHGLQVVHRVIGADGSPLAFGIESNVAPFVLRPVVAVPAAPATTATAVVLDVDPPVRAGQKVALLLHGAGDAFRFDAGELAADAAQLELAISGVPSGGYLAQLSVDGAQSVLVTDASGTYVGPEVTVP